VDIDLSDLPLSLLKIADVYSLGVVFWEIATRETVDIPIGMEHKEFFVMEGYSVPTSFKSLVERCLKGNPNDRPKLAEIAAVLQSLLNELNPERRY
jgi:serine/threonine protein kinase